MDLHPALLRPLGVEGAGLLVVARLELALRDEVAAQDVLLPIARSHDQCLRVAQVRRRGKVDRSQDERAPERCRIDRLHREVVVLQHQPGLRVRLRDVEVLRQQVDPRRLVVLRRLHVGPQLVDLLDSVADRRVALLPARLALPDLRLAVLLIEEADEVIVLDVAPDHALRVGDLVVQVAVAVEALGRAVQKERLLLRAHRSPDRLRDLALRVLLADVVALVQVRLRDVEAVLVLGLAAQPVDVDVLLRVQQLGQRLSGQDLPRVQPLAHPCHLFPDQLRLPVVVGRAANVCASLAQEEVIDPVRREARAFAVLPRDLQQPLGEAPLPRVRHPKRVDRLPPGLLPGHELDRLHVVGRLALQAEGLLEADPLVALRRVVDEARVLQVLDQVADLSFDPVADHDLAPVDQIRVLLQPGHRNSSSLRSSSSCASVCVLRRMFRRILTAFM